MISVFDVDKLRKLLKDFYRICRIRITVFDENLNELVSYPAEVAPYCAVIRSTVRGFEACMKCDRQACERAKKKHGTHVYRCHAGLTEAAAPLYVGGVLVGYLLFGHVFSYADYESGRKAVLQCCADLPLDTAALENALSRAEILPVDYIHSAAQILHAVASYLILEHMATLKEDLLAVRLDSYISAHYTERLDAVRLSGALGIGKTQLYELSRRLYGQGTAAHVRSLRMAKAKELLRKSPDLPLAEVAGQCGYNDYNYFFTVFSRETGCTPTEWRKGI